MTTLIAILIAAPFVLLGWSLFVAYTVWLVRTAGPTSTSAPPVATPGARRGRVLRPLVAHDRPLAQDVENYRYALERLAERLGGERELLAATLADLRDYLADRLEGDLTRDGVRRLPGAAFVLRMAPQGGEIHRNPAERLRGEVPETPVQDLSEVDYRRLLAACPKATDAGRRDAAVLAVLWATGARRGEISRLDVDSLDLELGTIAIGRTKNGTPRRVPARRRRPGAPRPLAPPPWLRHRSALHRRARRAPHVQRDRPDDRPAADTAGVTISAHTFRRLWRRAGCAGGGETALRSIAGWRSPAMVGRYTRMHAEELAHAEYRRLLG